MGFLKRFFTKTIRNVLKIPLFSYCFIAILKLFKRNKFVDDHIFNIEILEKYNVNSHSSSLNKLPLSFNNKKFDLAIIVPCFNVEKYISECADSILNQITDYKIQLIFVDDGSTDNTGQILEKKYKNHDGVTIIHQQNHGLSSARNTGIKHCLASYITFVDSDDYICNPHIFNNILKFIKSLSLSKTDRVIVGYRFSKNSGNGARKKNKKRILVKSTNCFKLKGFACGKVYSSELFSNVCFPDGYWFEDTINSLLLFHMANKSFLINDDGYYYRKHENTITKSSIKNYKAIDTFYITSSVIHDYFALDIKSHYINRSLMRQIAYNYKRLQGFGEDINKSVFVETRKLISRYSISKNVGLKYHHIYQSLVKNNYSLYKIACKVTQ